MESLGRGTVGTAGVLLDELVLRTLRFPVWWYTEGLLSFGRWCVETVAGWLERTGLRVWVRNLFVPMFGDYSRSGRIISFFVRLVLVVVQSVGALVGAAILLVALVGYFLLPILLAVQLVYQFGGPLVLG